MDDHLCLYAEVYVGIRIIDVDLHADHRASLCVACSYLVDLGHFALIFPVSDRDVRFLAQGDLGKVVFGNGNVNLYLLVALDGEKLRSLRNGSTLQKAAARGCIRRR